MVVLIARQSYQQWDKIAEIVGWRTKSYRMVAGEGLEPPTPGL